MCPVPVIVRSSSPWDRGAGPLLAQGLAPEFDSVQVLLDPIHHGVGNGRLSKRLVPVGYRRLAREDGCTQLGPVFDDFQWDQWIVG